MLTQEELLEKFLSLSEEDQHKLFREITNNIIPYSRMFPTLPLLRYIIYGESEVPVEQHGPVITKYKAWKANNP